MSVFLARLCLCTPLATAAHTFIVHSPTSVADIGIRHAMHCVCREGRGFAIGSLPQEDPAELNRPIPAGYTD
jgi:hypothetical protein